MYIIICILHMYLLRFFYICFKGCAFFGYSPLGLTTLTITVYMTMHVEFSRFTKLHTQHSCLNYRAVMYKILYLKLRTKIKYMPISIVSIASSISVLCKLKRPNLSDRLRCFIPIETLEKI